MITVKAQKNPRTAQTYFDEHLGRDDYYKEGDQVPGQWQGKLASQLGLSGTVDKQSFRHLAQGLNPNGEKLTQRLRHDRVAYFDFVCSAPKSVSIMGLVAGDGRVVHAHQRASESAFRFLERSASVRDRKGAQVLTTARHYTGNVVAAAFDHDASRSLDCQLHRHMCVFNVTKDRDGTFKALDARRMYEHSKAATAVYRSELARRLGHMGYKLTVSEKDLVVVGVSPQLLERFSGRSNALRRIVAEREEALGRKLAPKEKSVLIHRNRDRKERIPSAVFKEGLKARLQPGEAEELARVVTAARERTSKGKPTIQRIPAKGLLYSKKKLPAIEVFRRLLVVGCGRVNCDRLEAALVGVDYKRAPARMSNLWSPSEAKMVESLLQRGCTTSLSRVLYCVALSTSQIERVLDVKAEMFK